MQKYPCQGRLQLRGHLAGQCLDDRLVMPGERLAALVFLWCRRGAGLAVMGHRSARRDGPDWPGGGLDAGRMQRQRRVLSRDDPPRAWFVVDGLSLYRAVGSAQVMAAQMRHLIEG